MNFWQNIPTNHAFSDHPILSQHGAYLSHEAYNYTKEKAEKHGAAMNPMQLMGLVRERVRQERGIELEPEVMILGRDK